MGAVGGTYTYGTHLETEWLEIVRESIPITGLPPAFDGYRIVLMADFHLYPRTRLEFIERVVNAAKGLRPDLVLLGGDYVLSTAESIFDLAPVLARVNARDGAFAVLGNHDHWKGAVVVRRGLQREGLPILHNEGLMLSRQGQLLYLAGVDDVWSGAPDLRAALENHSGEVPVVLLVHEPDPADRFCQDARIVLQLSAHSHGGQVRLPGIGAPFLPPLGRKYDLGLYRVHGSWLYTNRGIGVTFPMRLNCRPEITEVTLTGAGRAVDSNDRAPSI